MNPNVTYTSYGNPNYSHSNSNSHGHGQQGHYRMNPSIHSTLNMDAISTTTSNNFANAGGYGGGVGGNHMQGGGGGGGGDRGRGGEPLARSMTRNSYLSYASTPSWVNPSTMMETSTPARTPRPLPDPLMQNNQGQMGYGYGGGGVGGQGRGQYGVVPVHGSSMDSRSYAGYANSQPQQSHGQQEPVYGHDQGEGQGYGEPHPGGRPHSGFYITNVAEEEEEDYVDHEEPETAGHGNGNGYPQYQNTFQGGSGGSGGYEGTTHGPKGYSMPVGMGGMGVPMERVAPPPQRRPLPIPGATQSMRRNGTLGSRSESTGKKKSFVGGFFLGLKRLPKTVLRYGSRKDKKRLAMNDEYDVGETGGLTAMHTGGTLPQYASNPATPTVGPYMKKSQTPPLLEEDESGMPGGMPLSPPVLNHPSLRLTPPSGETLGQMNPEDQQYFQSPEQEDYQQPPAEYPPPNVERGRTTLMYHEEPQQRTNATTATTTTTSTSAPSSQSTSENPPTVTRQPVSATPISRVTSNQTQGLASERTRSTAPTAPNPINTSINPPQNVRSPQTAHPQPANDYMKMTTSPVPTGTQATEVSEYTTFSSDPSFSTELHPVFRFFHSFYYLPWVSDRPTVDYSPLVGFGGKTGGRGVVKKAGQSWYKRKGDVQGGLTSASLDILGMEGDSGSVLSPLGGWRRRVTRRNTVDQGGGRSGRRHHKHHHSRDGRRHHGQGHGHGVPRGRRYRRRSTSTITFEEYHHQRNPSPMIPSTYPFPFVSPPFPYFQAFPAAAATGGSPAHVDASMTANQGTPGPVAGGAADGRPGENPKEGQTGQSGQTTRGIKGGRGSRAAIYPHGYAAYSPSPQVYPAPVWMAQGYASRGEGSGGEQGGPGHGHRGVVYMPVVPGAYV